MQLLVPSALWFLAAAAIPPVIYLIFRRRREDVRWGAMYILRRLMESSARQNIWLQYIIVALRALAFAAFAFMMVQAFFPWQAPQDSSFPSAPAATHRIVLLDLSRGMELRQEGGTAADAALSLCRKLVRAMNEPGRIDIIPLGRSDETVTFDQFAVDESELIQALSAFTPKDTPATVAAGLRDAMSCFREHGEFEHRELYLLSDFGARTWGDLQGTDGVLETLADMQVHLMGMEYRRKDASNFALLDLTCQTEVLLAGQAVPFALRTGCYGAGEKGETWLTITDQNKTTLYDEAITLTPGEQTVPLSFALPAGEITVTASLRDENMTWDNTITRTYRVQEELHVALIQNITMTRGFDNPREWLNLALVQSRKSTPAAGGTSHAANAEEAIAEAARAKAQSAKGAKDCRIVLEGKIPEQLALENIKESDAVIILDVESLTPEQVDALRSYMTRGGTVLLAPGPSVRAEGFNATFGNIAPMRLLPPSDKPIDPEQYESCLADRPDDPIIRELEAPRHGNIGNPRFYNHYGTAPGSLRKDATLLLSLSDGAPLLAECPIGRGRCLLWTAGLGGDWHSLVVHPGYPVFLVRTLTRAAAGKRFPFNLTPGSSIVRTLDAPRGIMILPSGERRPVTASTLGDRHVIRFDDTNLPGTYTLLEGEDDTAPTVAYHVTEDRRASDIRALGAKQRARLEQSIASPLVRSETALAAEAGGRYAGTALALVAALVAVMCLILESGLSRKWFS